ncbi:uncharacterized protein SPPG_02529 [Spizellomyces punctatus DAOM BR117]|uniref:PH domain-containing protein n=1 Tax=Spizellomyces punctatus (strain DAOM BR117) TaxID=645134 RepID=A0A0L0HM84_SPIPD|nr:uncharacterized protein SPPG_02529 [Spizellomyces punctatus DAOM BR117]KND02025.1 hypothetical protein SPPG_02529 [Spizellomyces punctatus DAOM BR117]|eukprot:XP_016610064.1 hypothetical protein SPPG_02529 [Spizellomyces punctatus DAOM BR117]
MTTDACLRFRDNFWADDGRGFSVLNNKLASSIECTKELAEMLSVRACFEEEYAKSMANMLKACCNKHDSGSVRIAGERITHLSNVIVNSHSQLAFKIRTDIEPPVLAFRQVQKRLKKTAEAEFEKFTKALDKNMANVQKASNIYAAKCRELIQANEKASNNGGKDRTQDKAVHCRIEMEQAEAEYKAAIARLDKMQDSWEEKMREIADQIEKSEQDRIEITKQTLRSLTDIQFELFAFAANRAMDGMRRAVDLIDPAADNDNFVVSCRTGSEPPARVKFQSYFSAANNTDGNKTVLLRVKSSEALRSPSRAESAESLPLTASDRSNPAMEQQLAQLQVQNGQLLRELAELSEKSGTLSRSNTSSLTFARRAKQQVLTMLNDATRTKGRVYQHRSANDIRTIFGETTTKGRERRESEDYVEEFAFPNTPAPSPAAHTGMLRASSTGVLTNVRQTSNESMLQTIFPKEGEGMPPATLVKVNPLVDQQIEECVQRNGGQDGDSAEGTFLPASAFTPLLAVDVMHGLGLQQHDDAEPVTKSQEDSSSSARPLVSPLPNLRSVSIRRPNIRPLSVSGKIAGTARSASSIAPLEMGVEVSLLGAFDHEIARHSRTPSQNTAASDLDFPRHVRTSSQQSGASDLDIQRHTRTPSQLTGSDIEVSKHTRTPSQNSRHSIDVPTSPSSSTARSVPWIAPTTVRQHAPTPPYLLLSAPVEGSHAPLPYTFQRAGPSSAPIPSSTPLLPPSSSPPQQLPAAPLPLIPKLTTDQIKHASHLFLYDDILSIWTRRWCVAEGGLLWVFDQQDQAQSDSKPRSTINLKKAEVVSAEAGTEPLEGKEYVFTVLTSDPKRKLVLKAENQEDLRKWMEAVDGFQ